MPAPLALPAGGTDEMGAVGDYSFEGASPEFKAGFYGSKKEVIWELHELEHVAQAEKYGPFYLPAYFALGGWWTNSNPFEQDANSSAREKMQDLGIYEQYQNKKR